MLFWLRIEHVISPSIYPIQLTVFLAALTKFYQMIIEN